jgi:integral membrane protein (TIGR01906 family)
MRKALIIILIIFLPLYSLLKSIEINVFNKNFYLKSYEEYNVPEITGKSLVELDNITHELLKYIKGQSDERILKPFFNEREIKHMEDVNVLFKYGFFLKNISLILSLLVVITFLYQNEVQKAFKGVFYGNFIWWGLVLLLFFASTIDFNKYFTYFHLIFFDNDLWLLDPETDLLIQMLPEEFFIDIFKRIVLFFISMLAIIQMTGYILMKKGKDGGGRTINF